MREHPYDKSTVDTKAAGAVSGSGRTLRIPGLCDVHVHFREPGFSYKETMRSGAAAAARGGYTAVCTMPNLDPVPDSLPHLREQLALIPEGGVEIRPYGAVSVGEKGEVFADLAALAPYVCAFSDDGKGVQSESFMRSAMEQAKKLGKLIAAHCENNALLNGGYIHDGDYAKAHGHRGISSESEYSHIARDIRLSKETGCAYHVCHISTKESVALIRSAKAEGVDISCETAPHYILLDDSFLQEDGRFKMNPPLRSPADREAILEGLRDGTIDMIATDHAPHSAEEKSRGLEKSLMGVVGLETAFPLLYTKLVRTGLLSLERLLELMCYAPRSRFGIPLREDYSIFEISTPYTIDPSDFLTLGRSTPFAGFEVFGRCLETVADGKVIYKGE